MYVTRVASGHSKNVSAIGQYSLTLSPRQFYKQISYMASHANLIKFLLLPVKYFFSTSNCFLPFSPAENPSNIACDLFCQRSVSRAFRGPRQSYEALHNFVAVKPQGGHLAKSSANFIFQMLLMCLRF